jgi:hypothetical protein
MKAYPFYFLLQKSSYQCISRKPLDRPGSSRTIWGKRMDRRGHPPAEAHSTVSTAKAEIRAENRTALRGDASKMLFRLRQFGVPCRFQGRTVLDLKSLLHPPSFLSRGRCYLSSYHKGSQKAKTKAGLPLRGKQPVTQRTVLRVQQTASGCSEAVHDSMANAGQLIRPR